MRWSLALVCAVALAPLVPSPTPVVAQEAGLAAGGTATVANTDGDGVVLREGPGYDARVLEGFPEGTAVTLTDGPIAAADGSVWYGVVVEGRDGYIVSDYLAPGSAVETGPTGEGTTLGSPGTTTIEANGPPVSAAAEGTSAPPAPRKSSPRQHLTSNEPKNSGMFIRKS